MKKKSLLTILIIIVFLVVLTQFVGIGTINSNSMEPTLVDGETVLINKLAYVINKPQRGDIVAFKKGGELMIKRVIGIESDSIKSIDGTILLNDHVLIEPFIEGNMETNIIEPVLVLDDNYYVLGDNREESMDSRYWENVFIDEKDIVGRVVYEFDTFWGSTVPRYETKTK